MCYITTIVAAFLIVGSAYAKEEKPNVLSAKEAKEGFVSLFDGRTLKGWQGDVKGYVVENGTIVWQGRLSVYRQGVRQFHIAVRQRANQDAAVGSAVSAAGCRATVI